MRRLYSENVSDERIELDDDQTRHARKVLRLRDGDGIELFDGHGNIVEGTLHVERGAAAVVVGTRRVEPRPQPWVDLAVAMPKGARADVLVEKTSELGVDRLIPLRTARSVVEASENRTARLARIAVESAKQSGRAHLMEVAEGVDFKQALEPGFAGAPRPTLRMIGDPSGFGSVASADLLKALAKVKRVLVLIGPEGGWTEQERDQAWEAGFVSWRMSPAVLRVETAAIAAAAICRQI